MSLSLSLAGLPTDTGLIIFAGTVLTDFSPTRRSLTQLDTSQNLPRQASRAKDDLSQHMIICPAS
jgi:hypothetical protein